MLLPVAFFFLPVRFPCRSGSYGHDKVLPHRGWSCIHRQGCSQGDALIFAENVFDIPTDDSYKSSQLLFILKIGCPCVLCSFHAQVRAGMLPVDMETPDNIFHNFHDIYTHGCRLDIEVSARVLRILTTVTYSNSKPRGRTRRKIRWLSGAYHRCGNHSSLWSADKVRLPRAHHSDVDQPSRHKRCTSVCELFPIYMYIYIHTG